MKMTKPGARLGNTMKGKEAMEKPSKMAGRPMKAAPKPKSTDDLRALFKQKFGKGKSSF